MPQRTGNSNFSFFACFQHRDGLTVVHPDKLGL